MIAATAGAPSDFSYREVLQYLERDFLPSLDAADSSIQQDEQSTALTPNRIKPVGESGLASPSDASSAEIESSLKDLAATIVPLFESALRGPTVNSFDVDAETGVALLNILHQCLEKIIFLTCSRQMKLSSFQILLVLSCSLVNDLSDLHPATLESHIKLTKAVCQSLRQLDKIPTTRGVTEHQMTMYSSCFCNCIGFCSKLMLLARESNHEGVEAKTSKALYGIFKDMGVIGSVLFQCRRVDRNKAITPLEASHVLDFFSLLATSHHAELISFLTDAEIAPVLNEILRSSSIKGQQQQSPIDSMGDVNNAVSSNTIRGYSSSTLSQNLAGTAGRRVTWNVDLQHENTIKVYHFLAVSIRAAAETYSVSHKDKAIKRRFVDRALYCLHSHRRSVSECLNQVASATQDRSGRLMGHVTAVGTHGLTIQLLREASSVFALLGELTGKNEVDLFCQQYAKLYEDLVRDSHQVVLSIASFLGSAGIARELFQIMADLEKGNGGSVLFGDPSSDPRLGLSPIIDIFSGSGRNNVRHEAIQFSHLVSGCSSAVSASEREDQSRYPDSWTPAASSSNSPGGAGQGGELTESSLEKNSKYAITNKFAFQLEMEAGLVLFHATNVLWATHPANSSFVEFTAEEISQSSDISFLKNKDVIAYRTGNAKAMGEVEHVDTVNLCCYVRPMHEKENAQLVCVHLHSVAGVEDRTKRQGVLTFSHAPENSSDLDRSRKELGIGHILMGLRWCHELGFELDRQQNPESKSWICKCAQSLALTLAKEVSLHREHSHARAAVEQIRMFNAQLLDLFGTEEEFSKCYDFDSSSLMRREGRMTALLSESFICAIRNELANEINSAIANILEMKSIQKQQQSQSRHHYQAGGTTSLMDSSRWRHQGSF